jgi:hypothetical protein
MRSAPVRTRRFDWIADLDHVQANMGLIFEAILEGRIGSTEEFELLEQELCELLRQPLSRGKARRVWTVLALTRQRLASARA